MRTPLFKLGTTVATRRVLTALEHANENLVEFLYRHASGDWGDQGEEDKQNNNEAMLKGSCIVSSYHLKTGVQIYVITEADRRSTRIMLAEEY